MDTCYKDLSLTLIDDNKIVASYNAECFKKQSEMIMVELDNLLKNNNLKLQNLDGICISQGPGSYTGVRIAMTVAKVIASQLKIKLFTISTLRLYANNAENTAVIMDARAKRCYFGIYNKDEVIKEDTIIMVEELKEYNNFNLIGDLELIDLENKFNNVSNCFLNTKEYWTQVENIDTLKPAYLKEYE
jgi:tRNA threonylcarbamoyl adenosine modification protein YeaZ